MINTLQIGEVVYERLSTIPTIGSKCYPLIAENSTTFPFIIYTRDGVEPIICKDGVFEDIAEITVKVVSTTYNESITIAQQVREKLTLHNFNFRDNRVDSVLSGATESYEENSYIQTLSFNIQISK